MSGKICFDWQEWKRVKYKKKKDIRRYKIKVIVYIIFI